MKWIARLLSFVAAFVLGVLVTQAPFATGSFDVADDSDVSICYGVDPAMYVKYTGWATFEQSSDAVLRFRIQNATRETVSYAAYSEGHPLPTVHINGKKVERFVCGTGIQTFYLSPGQSIEVNVPTFEFNGPTREGDQATVGFYLKSANDQARLITSEPFEIPEMFRKKIN